MKNHNEFFEALRDLSRNQNHIQEQWEEWNGVKWDEEFDYDLLKEGDCFISPDQTINFVENRTGKTFVRENGGWLLYENQTLDLIEVQNLIDEEMEEIKELGFSSDDC